MGEVYRATDTKLKRQVAIKILPPALVADLDRLASSGPGAPESINTVFGDLVFANKI